MQHDPFEHFLYFFSWNIFVPERVEQCLKISNVPRVMFHAILKLKQTFDFDIVLDIVKIWTSLIDMTTAQIVCGNLI